MFWAITCESGKRYSQVPEEPFHVSMAALEPRDKVPENKHVSLMIEHKGKEFLLCTLEYDKVMQVGMNLNFSKGEETFFFVSGEGTIHLSGYLDVGAEVLQKKTLNSVGDAYLCDSINEWEEADNVDDHDEEEEMNDEDDNDEEMEDTNENEELGTERLLELDDSEEEDSEDSWQPEMDKANRHGIRRSSEDGELDNADSDEDDGEKDEEEESSDLEEISEEENGKPNQFAGPSSSFKRPRSEISPKGSGFKDVVNSSNKKRKKMKAGKEADQEGESLLTQLTSSESENDELNSSIGRTPMPPKKVGFMKAPKPILKSNASLEHSAKTNRKESANKSDKSVQSEAMYSKKLPCGIEMEDVKTGNGPVAKKGKYVHVYYIGKFTNNKVFDSVKPGSGKPLSFRLGKQEVIKGWDFGLEGMRVGGTRLLKVPPELAYGKKGRGPIPPNSTLLFTIDLKAVS